MAKVQNQKSQVVSSKEMNEMDYLMMFYNVRRTYLIIIVLL